MPIDFGNANRRIDPRVKSSMAANQVLGAKPDDSDSGIDVDPGTSLLDNNNNPAHFEDIFGAWGLSRAVISNLDECNAPGFGLSSHDCFQLAGQALQPWFMAHSVFGGLDGAQEDPNDAKLEFIGGTDDNNFEATSTTNDRDGIEEASFEAVLESDGAVRFQELPFRGTTHIEGISGPRDLSLQATSFQEGLRGAKALSLEAAIHAEGHAWATTLSYKACLNQQFPSTLPPPTAEQAVQPSESQPSPTTTNSSLTSRIDGLVNRLTDNMEALTSEMARGAARNELQTMYAVIATVPSHIMPEVDPWSTWTKDSGRSLDKNQADAGESKGSMGETAKELPSQPKMITAPQLMPIKPYEGSKKTHARNRRRSDLRRARKERQRKRNAIDQETSKSINEREARRAQRWRNTVDPSKPQAYRTHKVLQTFRGSLSRSIGEHLGKALGVRRMPIDLETFTTQYEIHQHDEITKMAFDDWAARLRPEDFDNLERELAFQEASQEPWTALYEQKLSSVTPGPSSPSTSSSSPLYSSTASERDSNIAMEDDEDEGDDADENALDRPDAELADPTAVLFDNLEKGHAETTATFNWALNGAEGSALLCEDLTSTDYGAEAHDSSVVHSLLGFDQDTGVMLSTPESPAGSEPCSGAATPRPMRSGEEDSEDESIELGSPSKNYATSWKRKSASEDVLVPSTLYPDDMDLHGASHTPIKRRSTRNTGKISKYFPSPQKEQGTPSPIKRSRAREELAGLLSCLPFPPLTNATYGLIQEELADDPFRLLIAVIFLNRTRGSVAIPIARQCLAKWASPEDIAHANAFQIKEMVQPLGLGDKRTEALINLAKGWIEAEPVHGLRYRTLGYPNVNDGRDIRDDEVLSDTDPRTGALEIGHFPGLGRYAYDSWRIFCRDKLRCVGLDEQPEWQRVSPEDKELRAYLCWMWLKEGFVWDPVFGDRWVAGPKLLQSDNLVHDVIEEILAKRLS